MRRIFVSFSACDSGESNKKPACMAGFLLSDAQTEVRAVHCPDQAGLSVLAAASLSESISS